MAASQIRPGDKLEPDEWGAKFRTYPASSGVPGPRNPRLTPYLIPWARVIAGRRYKRAVAITAAQSGKTENLLDIIGSRLDQAPVPIIYVGPSRDFIKDQFEPRLSALFDEAPTLGAKLGQGQDDKKFQKLVGGVKIRLGYAGSSTSLKSDPFGLGIIDEYDEMAASIKGQGDPLGLTEARGDTYPDTVTAITSTPSQGKVETEICPVNGLKFWAVAPNDMVFSPIWRVFQTGTRHHFAWCCPHCDRYFIPRSENLIIAKDATAAQARRDAYVLCGYDDCGGVITEEHKEAMNEGGIMIAPGQTVEDAIAGRNPENETWSSWTSGLCSRFQTFWDRAARLVEARLSGDPNKVQTAKNAAFGELDMPVGESDTPEWEKIKERVVPYHEGEIPSEAVRLFLTVDVQRFSLPYVVRAWGARGKSWLVKHGELYGATDRAEVWDALFDLAITPIAGMNIEKAMVDSGFRPNKVDGVNEHAVYEFCRRHSWLFIPTKGRDVQRRPYQTSRIEVKPDGRRATYAIDLVHLSTDYFKSMLMSRMAVPINGPQAWHVHTDIDEDYCRQVTSEARTMVDGKPVWTRRSRNNHYLDCEAMQMALAFVYNMDRLPDPQDYADEGEAPPDGVGVLPASSAPPVGAPPFAQDAPGGGGGSTRDRFAQRGRNRNR